MSIIIAPILNNFKNVSGAEKLLMKKILMKFINDLHIYYSDATDELKNKLRQSINGSMAFGDIIVGAINGQVSIEPPRYQVLCLFIRVLQNHLELISDKTFFILYNFLKVISSLLNSSTLNLSSYLYKFGKSSFFKITFV